MFDLLVLRELQQSMAGINSGIASNSWNVSSKRNRRNPETFETPAAEGTSREVLG
jgi:hypothetical protein